MDGEPKKYDGTPAKAVYPENEAVCPFCGTKGFDLVGLKMHFVLGWCDVYETVGGSAVTQSK
jgi:hypothetical protein